jgi:poly-gamma-glutamate synthesis protein (capsule biosynthesis protein)
MTGPNSACLAAWRNPVVSESEGAAPPVAGARIARPVGDDMPRSSEPRDEGSRITLFLCGDVMTGRGIDQILPHPSMPHLSEPGMRSAIGYVELAERESGPIPRRVHHAYIWGDALAELTRLGTHVRIVNLETAVTVAEDAWPGKDVHYRMHPANVPCLTAAGIDCCVLANNHVLDWGPDGLLETLETLHNAGIHTAGAGRNDEEAAALALVELPSTGRVLVFAFGTASSGVGRDWAAGRGRPGVNRLDDLSGKSADAVARQVGAVKRPGDVVVASMHWGSNWGFGIPREQRTFAHRLIDVAGVDVVHGHSSHHVKGIEVYRDRLILYGCGDFLTDYEGIRGYDEFRDDLGLMYFPTLDVASGRLVRVVLTPTRIRRFRVNRAPEAGAQWLLDTLTREGRGLGTRVHAQADGTFLLAWE